MIATPLGLRRNTLRAATPSWASQKWLIRRRTLEEGEISVSFSFPLQGRMLPTLFLGT